MRASGGHDVSRWPTLGLDGAFGPDTERAVKAFQQAHPDSGPADGIVGRLTWREINKICADTWPIYGFYSLTCFGGR